MSVDDGLDAACDHASTAPRWSDDVTLRVPAAASGHDCRWEHLLDGRWSVVRRRTGAGRIVFLANRNRSASERRLTALERKVIQLAVTGEYNTQVASALGVHESTVSRTLSRALRKLGLVTRADLIVLYAALVRR